MKAAVLRRVGAPLEIEDIEISRPGAREVLVRTAATGVCDSDLHVVDGALPNPLPMVLGHEPAGIVEAVGAEVRQFAPGDHVIGCLSVFCGMCEYCVAGRAIPVRWRTRTDSIHVPVPAAPSAFSISPRR